ncbi:MAG: hypothetical protein ACAH59_05530 [Pseudobdellovibrionaceae bacterium]
MESNNQRLTNIVGWGADLEPSKRPAYPKERTPPRFINPHWADKPSQQVPRFRVFKSIDLPQLTPIFGTSVPPQGLSGAIRSWAYKINENKARHWFLLLFADRVNVIEGFFSDLSKGYFPKIFSEMGWKAEWKYNRSGAVKKMAIAGGIIGLGAFLLMRRRSPQISWAQEEYDF